MVILFGCFLIGKSIMSQTSANMNFEDFALNYSPTYLVGLDTIAVSQVPQEVRDYDEEIKNDLQGKHDYILLVFLKSYLNHLECSNSGFDYCYLGQSEIHVAMYRFLDISYGEYPCHDVDDSSIYRYACESIDLIELKKVRKILKKISRHRARLKLRTIQCD